VAISGTPPPFHVPPPAGGSGRALPKGLTENLADSPALEIHADVAALARAAAAHVVTHARDAIAASGRFSIALSGGSTPRPVYELLARPPHATEIDWSRVHVFWGDERCVPPEHPDSNYRMACEALLDRVPVPAAQVHRIRGEIAPAEAARDYEQLLRGFFAADDGAPVRTFDLVLLGMGEDGHTASLFPGTPAVIEPHRWVMATRLSVPHEMWRITLTPVVLDAAAAVTFLVTGAGKAARLSEVLDGTARETLPAARIRPASGPPCWMVDQAAAARLVRQP